MGSPKSKAPAATSPAPATRTAPPVSKDSHHESEFTTRTVLAVVTRPRHVPDAAGTGRSITVTSHSPGATVPCTFTVGGAAARRRSAAATLSVVHAGRGCTHGSAVTWDSDGRPAGAEAPASGAGPALRQAAEPEPRQADDLERVLVVCHARPRDRLPL